MSQNPLDETEQMYCQDCGRMLLDDMTGFDDVCSGVYVTTFGDVFCIPCGRSYDEADEDQVAEDGWWDEYGSAWYDPDSNLDELEDTPQTRYIGEGSEHLSRFHEGDDELYPGQFRH